MDEITDHLRRRIISGELGFGRALPPIRKLAALYGVSLPSMQAALHSLAALGLVRITHGVGTYVRSSASHAAVLDHAWRGATATELALMRAAIDERLPPMVARRLRQHGTSRPLRAAVSDIRFLAAERSMSRHATSAEEFVDADLAFHVRIAACLPEFAATASVYQQLGRLLIPELRVAAQQEAADSALDACHIGLANAVLAGELRPAVRYARTVARRELRALGVR